MPRFEVCMDMNAGDRSLSRLQGLAQPARPRAHTRCRIMRVYAVVRRALLRGRAPCTQGAVYGGHHSCARQTVRLPHDVLSAYCEPLLGVGPESSGVCGPSASLSLLDPCRAGQLGRAQVMVDDAIF